MNDILWDSIQALIPRFEAFLKSATEQQTLINFDEKHRIGI